MSKADRKIHPLETVPTSIIPRRNVKLLSAGYSFFVAGTNDGSMGALLPWMILDYEINTSLIALMYVASFRITTSCNLKTY
jgi:hypothetical protein